MKDINMVVDKVIKKLVLVNVPSSNCFIDKPKLYTGMKKENAVGSPEPNILA